MKPVLLVLVLLSPIVLWFAMPAVRAQDGSSVSARIHVGWEIRAEGPAGELLASGSPLVVHPDYLAFKQAVTDVVLTEVPSDVRNAWPFHQIQLNEQGFKPEEEIRQELSNALAALNTRREEVAQAAGNPVPPDFTLSTGEPEKVVYEIFNDTRVCKHTYHVDLAGSPWVYTDPAIPATARYSVTLSFESRLD